MYFTEDIPWPWLSVHLYTMVEALSVIQQQLNAISTVINSKTSKYCSWKTIRPLLNTLEKILIWWNWGLGLVSLALLVSGKLPLIWAKLNLNQLQSTSASDLASPWRCSDILVMVSVDQPAVSSWGQLGPPYHSLFFEKSENKIFQVEAAVLKYCLL